MCASAFLIAGAALAGADGADSIVSEAPAPAVGFLADALAETAEAVASSRPRQADLTLCVDPDAPLLDAYVTHMLAAHLSSRGVTASRFAARLPRAAGTPVALPGPVLKALRNATATTFVHAAAPLDAGQRCLAVDIHDVGSGALVRSLRVPVRLSHDQAELVTRERERMSASDADWLELLEEAFGPPAAEDASDRSPVDVAESEFMLDAGLWDVAAAHFLALAPAGPDREFMRGVLALRLAGRSDEAVRLAEAARRDHPESSPLCTLLSWLKLRSGREGDAVLLLEQARLSDMTREGLYRYAEGLMALEAGNDEVAEARLSRAATLLPDTAFAQLRLARFYRNRGRLEQAVACYRRALQNGNAEAETWAELALALRLLGDQNGALAALKQAFAIRSSNVTINRQLAAILRSRGRHEEALEFLRKAAEAHPHDPAVLAAYGDVALQMWQVKAARQSFEEAVALDGDFPYATVRLASVLATQQECRRARELLEDLLARQPDYNPARIALGRMLGRMGQFDDAVSVLQATTVGPAHEADARLALAEVHAAAGHVAEAIDSAQIAASSRPDAESYAALSAAFLAAKDLAKAENAARTAVAQDDGNARALLALARVLREKGQTDEASVHVSRVVQIDPYCVEALEVAGLLAQDGGDERRCVELWRRALALNPWNAELHHELGRVLGPRLGDWDAAREHMIKWAELEAKRTSASD